MIVDADEDVAVRDVATPQVIVAGNAEAVDTETVPESVTVTLTRALTHPTPFQEIITCPLPVFPPVPE